MNARDLHAYMGIGRDFSNWMNDRIEKFQLIKDVDYDVCSPDLGSKECGVGSKGRGGSNVKAYHLTLTAARWLAADVNSDKGRQLIKFLVALMEKVERVEKLEPPAATFLLPTTFAEALRLAADKAEENEKLKLEVREAVAEVQVSSTKADQLMSVRAAEDVSIPLSVWLGRGSD